ncbi:hypothetical protein [Acinetobacter phage P577]|uniref:hypothetical protein n=1 Tax=Acinetobacter phage YMC13/03/R2096 TaxID=1560342 RepID=UPI00052AC6E4|nr:hypothetical protein ACQ36_gp102 [Acinetobacter phage YMC13/03/R2096]AIW02831.1 hypothetical protein BPABA577_00970 [Acinetobacter phage YMC13/03/R2096]WNT46155.1 hypothetical protein [Acinetobacter phage P577]
MGLESVEDLLKLLAKVKMHAAMVRLAEVQAGKSGLEVARAWFSVCRGHYVVPKPTDEYEPDFEEDRLKIVGLVEDGEKFKFEFETSTGSTVQLGGRLHADYILVDSQDVDPFEIIEQLTNVLGGEDLKKSDSDSPIKHLLS